MLILLAAMSLEEVVPIFLPDTFSTILFLPSPTIVSSLYALDPWPEL
jgi:hypothetical protein